MAEKHLILNQIGNETVQSGLIEKIYNICINQDKGLQFKEYDDSSSISGTINVNYTYQEYISKINTHFPNLVINASNYFYYFQDPVQRSIVKEVFADTNGVIQDLGTLSNLDAMYNHANYNNIQILDLRPFYNYNFTASPGHTDKNSKVDDYRLPTNLKYLILNKSTGCDVAYWPWIRNNLEYIYIENILPNAIDSKYLYGATSPSYLWNDTRDNPVFIDTVVLKEPANGKVQFFSEFGLGCFYNIGNLYLNLTTEHTWTYTYGSNDADGNPNGTGSYFINNLYVPSVTYNYYKEFFKHCCDPDNIHEYDFTQDPNNVLPNHKTFI